MLVNVKRSSCVVMCHAMKCMQLRVLHHKYEQITHDNMNVCDIFSISCILEFVVCFAKVKRLKM